MSDETALVIALSRHPLAARSARARELLETRRIDWPSIFVIARRWGVEPMVWENLRSHFENLIPAGVSPAIDERERVLKADAVANVGVLMRIANELAAARIPVIVFKGPAIAISGYGAYSRRTFLDIDLLVRKEDLPGACQVVRSLGFVADYRSEIEEGLVSGGHALTFSSDYGQVELHWKLMPHQLHFDFDLDAIWRDAKPMEGLPALACQLSLHHSFLYLCAHGSKHDWDPLRWIADVAQLATHMTREDATKTVELAERHGGRRFLALGLRVVRSTYPGEASVFPESAFGDTRETEHLLKFAMAKQRDGERPRFIPSWLESLHPYMASFAFWVASRERRRDRIACIANLLFVPGADQVDRGFVNRALKPLRLATRAAAKAR